MIAGVDRNGRAVHTGAAETTEDPWPSPSQVGEDEEARDDVMRIGPSRAL